MSVNMDRWNIKCARTLSLTLFFIPLGN